MINSLKIYVQRIKNLPTLPVVAQEVLSIADSDTTSVQKLEKIIENDPAIAAKILSVANSAFFGVSVPVKSLGSAIVRIGFNNVKNIALGISLLTVLANGKHGSRIEYQRIFNHSVTVGFIARTIAKKCKLAISDEILMNGLLHDIGYLILNNYFPDNYSRVINIFEQKGEMLVAEDEVLNFSHADMGAWLAEEWELPANVIDTTRFHHSPSMSKTSNKQVSLIHLSDYIASRGGMAPTADNPNYPLDRTALDLLGISVEKFAELETEVSGMTFLNGMSGL